MEEAIVTKIRIKVFISAKLYVTVFNLDGFQEKVLQS
jgi:hypothetical protein